MEEDITGKKCQWKVKEITKNQHLVRNLQHTEYRPDIMSDVMAVGYIKAKFSFKHKSSLKGGLVASET